ncbi:porin [Pseudoduganella sp. LjRoot289]|uniref:porin n=1 Tax=Pseudoduganella sp. LjRoot289 TaxID=3342314 RepID=UPI003ED10A64
MKKSMMLLVLLGALGHAFAQSALTMYGTIDGGLRYVTNADAAGNGKLTMTSNGTSMSNRLGFRGVEDLGDGYNAHFALETGFINGTGALDVPNTLFNRTAIVGIGGAFGNIDVGRQYTVAFRTIAVYEPFSFRFPLSTYAVAASAGFRFNNDIQYSGTVGPVTVRAEYAPGEQAGSVNNGTAKAVGASYSLGSLAFGGAYTRRTLPVAGAYRENSHATLGAAYKGDALRVAAGYADEKQETGALDTRSKYSWLGGEYSISPFVKVGSAYYWNKTESAGGAGKRDTLILTSYYTLSKRTSLYGEIDRTNFDGKLAISAAQTHQTGVSIGLNHLF